MKQNVQFELVKLDLADVIEKLNYSAARQLQDIDIKQLEGRTPEDFVQDMFLKVLDGTRSWENANTDDIMRFLRMTLRSEISNFMKYLKRRNVGLFSENEEADDYIDYSVSEDIE